MSLRNWKLDFEIILDKSVKTTIHYLDDVGLFDRFDSKDQTFKEHITSNKRQRGDLEEKKEDFC